MRCVFVQVTSGFHCHLIYSFLLCLFSFRSENHLLTVATSAHRNLRSILFVHLFEARWVRRQFSESILNQQLRSIFFSLSNDHNNAIFKMQPKGSWFLCKKKSCENETTFWKKICNVQCDIACGLQWKMCYIKRLTMDIDSVNINTSCQCCEIVVGFSSGEGVKRWFLFLFQYIVLCSNV